MNFKDQLTFIRRNMKKNRLRVFMTILATTVACSFLIVLASVGFGLQKSMTESLMSDQLVTEIKVFGNDDHPDQQIQKKDLKEVEKYEHVTAIFERTEVYPSVPMKAKYEERTNHQFSGVTITDMVGEQRANLKLDRGRVAKSPNEIVVGYHFGKQLWTKQETESYEKQTGIGGEEIKEPKGYKGDILGKTIELKVAKAEGKKQKNKVKTYDMKVVGILKKPSHDWQKDSSVYVSNQIEKDVLGFLKKDEGFSKEKQVVVYADSAEHVGDITDALEDKGFHVDSITKKLDSLNLFFIAFKMGLIFVGVIAVLISAIGIFNTMTMAVTERTQEIGIMKAIGASPNIIRKMFLLESAYIGVIGSVFGIMISYFVSFLVNKFLPVILSSVSHGGGEEFHITFSYIPLSLVLIATAISAGVAILSGLNPAIKATKMNVLTALRREL
ncbi:ABC transporter permease [Bacillus sp. CLL-7-23]|uniref:ABC transporter permease n=1 Tax=Bacillus changyiensis TaxID=3004103 RepID=A0ABT4X4V4_9BACI|nr:ABC transporter permease [Bacillus changyiensis]MDA7027301.1 ABC transporter permease [Bacillus changyiensis]